MKPSNHSSNRALSVMVVIGKVWMVIVAISVIVLIVYLAQYYS
jgi:hypothetical protein